MTKTPIGKIDNLPIEVNDIIVLIKFNPDSNSDNNNNKNNGSSSVQNNNKNNNNPDFNSNLEQYIVLPDLTKKQELKWFSDNNKSIIPEHMYDTDTEFDLKYLRKNTIKLEPHSCIYIDLKIALEISATTIVQLASRSGLAKKGINIRREIINTIYIKNIIIILQNDSKKVYIIEPNKKITQAIFLLLIKVAQLVLIEKREELRMTVKRIQEFGSTSRINVSVNMIEEKVINKREIISNYQSISISSYNQYILAIEREVKNQAQIFEAEITMCKSEKIGLTNLYILAKNPKHIKILIYNTTEDVFEIPKRTTIGYLSTETKKMLFAPIRTIGTDELEKSRPTTMYIA
ncbi:hypothetical protein G9A89_023563 [Geosiphon pyriformis]|nr:hypothetical protein G9A89_023563 [Geosiphon pyriformis]